MESPAGNQDAASPTQLLPVVVQPGYANPGQPPSVPVIVVGGPYYAPAPGVPYVPQQADKTKKVIAILLATGCCIFVFVIAGIFIAQVIRKLDASLRKIPDEDESKTETVIDGIVFGNSLGVFLVSLPSLEQKVISSEPAHFVAFDWNSRKVYWINGSPGATKRANLDGTDVEDVPLERAVKLAVDWITGNVYYIKLSPNASTHDIRVCTKSGEKCSTLATNQLGAESIALYHSKGLMFWTNQTSTVQATMHGTQVEVIRPAQIWHMNVDEDSNQLFWVESSRTEVRSRYLGGGEKIELDYGGGDIHGLAVDAKRSILYLSDHADNKILSVDERAQPALIARTSANVTDLALYGSKKYIPGNPCANPACSPGHLCVLKSDSYACVCPDGSQDDLTCSKI